MRRLSTLIGGPIGVHAAQRGRAPGPRKTA